MSFSFQDGLLPTFDWLPERAFCRQSRFGLGYSLLSTMLTFDRFPHQMKNYHKKVKIRVKKSISKPKLKDSWEEVEVASLDMLPDFGCSQLRSVGAWEEGGHCQGGIVLTMFQARHCPALRQPQQHQQRHCDVRGDVGGGDIVIKWGEQGGGEEHHNQGRAVAAALVFWGKCHRGFNWPIFHCHPVRRAKGKRGVITWAAALAFNIHQQQLLQKLKVSLFNWLVNESDRVGRVKETSLRECPIAYPASPCYFDKCQRLKKEPQWRYGPSVF